MTIELSKEKEARLVASIKRYFAEHMDEEIGDLKAALFLDYCLKEIGPCVYNQAIADAQRIMQEKVSDIENTCFAMEFSYWRKDRTG
jgi:uncharacterized protein (DUF2164 family)